ncbi:MAG TPA: hypothetical protein VGG72_06590 [Bryobacteraceae bacterium]
MNRRRHPMRLRDGGIWEIFIPGIAAGTQYKYFVLSHDGGEQGGQHDQVARVPGRFNTGGHLLARAPKITEAHEI